MSDSDHGNVPQGCKGNEEVVAAPMVDKANFDHSETINLRRNKAQANSPLSNGISNAHESHGCHSGKAEYDVEACNEKEQDKLLQRPTDVPSKESKCTIKNCRGWLVVVASWIVMIPVAGTLASYGVLVDSLKTEFNATNLQTGWIGSLAFGFTVGTCPISTPLFTVFGGRKLAAFGVLSGSASLVATSFVPVINLMFLTYSILFGVSANFIYNSAMTLTGQYFTSEHQALATCLASAGISFGTLCMNPFAQYLVEEVQWRNTLRILSGMVLVVGMICICAFKPVKTPEQKVVTKLKHIRHEERNRVLEIEIGSNRDLNKHAITESLQNCNESKISLAAQEIKKNVLDKSMYDCSVCGDASFILWMLGTLFWSLSFLFPLIFLIDYMGTIGIDPASGALVMTAYGIAEFCGRLLCATVADRLPFSLSYVYGGSSVLMGIATLLAPLGRSLSFMYIYSIAVGVNSGILNSLMFATTMQLFGFAKGRHVWGYINVMLALGMVVGPMQAGIIYDATNSYQTSFYVGGGMFLISAITMFLLPVAKRCCPKKEKEAVGKREQQIPVQKKSGPRNSLRSALFAKDIAKRQLTSKPKWKSGAASDVRELKDLQEELGPL